MSTHPVQSNTAVSTAPAVVAAFFVVIPPIVFVPGQIGDVATVVFVTILIAPGVFLFAARFRRASNLSAGVSPAGALRPAIGVAVGGLLWTVGACGVIASAAPPHTAIAVAGQVYVGGRATHDLRPSADGMRVLEIAPGIVGDRRGWNGSVSGRFTLFWDGPETLVSLRGDERLVPLKGDWVDIAIDAGQLRDRYGSVDVGKIAIVPRNDRGAAFRRRIRGSIISRFSRLRSDARGVLTALILGDRSGIDPVLSDNVRRSGASHVLALSGMHLGVLAAIVGLAIGRFLPRRYATIVTVLLLGAYVWIAGAIPSLLRALAMVVVSAVSTLRHRRVAAIVLLARGILLLAVLDPTIPYELGFQYSVTALSGLILLAPRIVSCAEYLVPRFLAFYGGASLAALLATAPLSIRYFGTVYLAGIAMAGVLSMNVVLLIWIGLLFAVVSGIPLIGTVLKHVVELFASILRYLAAAGAQIPAIELTPAGAEKPISPEALLHLLPPLLLLASLLGGVLLLRRRQRTQFERWKGQLGESQFDL